MLEALFRSVPDVSMRIQFRYEISEHLGDLLDSYIHEPVSYTHLDVYKRQALQAYP